MDPFSLEQRITQLEALVNGALSQVGVLTSSLEAQSAKDVNQIADKVLAGLTPVTAAVTAAVETVNGLTLVVSASVTEVAALARRLDGASLKLTLGPESSVPDTNYKPEGMTTG